MMRTPNAFKDREISFCTSIMGTKDANIYVLTKHITQCRCTIFYVFKYFYFFSSLIFLSFHFISFKNKEGKTFTKIAFLFDFGFIYRFHKHKILICSRVLISFNIHMLKATIRTF